MYKFVYSPSVMSNTNLKGVLASLDPVSFLNSDSQVLANECLPGPLPLEVVIQLRCELALEILMPKPQKPQKQEQERDENAAATDSMTNVEVTSIPIPTPNPTNFDWTCLSSPNLLISQQPTAGSNAPSNVDRDLESAQEFGLKWCPRPTGCSEINQMLLNENTSISGARKAASRSRYLNENENESEDCVDSIHQQQQQQPSSGLPPASMIELLGVSGSGRTVLSLSTICSCALAGMRVLVLDTSNGINPTNLNEGLAKHIRADRSNTSTSIEESRRVVSQAMQRIHLQRVFTLWDLMNAVTCAVDNSKQMEDDLNYNSNSSGTNSGVCLYHLVVVDSLSTLLLPYKTSGETQHQSQQQNLEIPLVSSICLALRRLCSFGSTALLTNSVYLDTHTKRSFTTSNNNANTLNCVGVHQGQLGNAIAQANYANKTKATTINTNVTMREGPPSALRDVFDVSLEVKNTTPSDSNALLHVSVLSRSAIHRTRYSQDKDGNDKDGFKQVLNPTEANIYCSSLFQSNAM